ncbi:MAG: single-stranded DNA-binding protein, partial [Patescibacteria group bacterium]
MDLNKVSFIGNLAGDPEAKTLPSGQNLALFKVATNYTWRDASTKEKRTRADFHKVVAWGK